jgi:hypothetical protein
MPMSKAAELETCMEAWSCLQISSSQESGSEARRISSGHARHAFLPVACPRFIIPGFLLAHKLCNFFALGRIA